MGHIGDIDLMYRCSLVVLSVPYPIRSDYDGAVDDQRIWDRGNGCRQPDLHIIAQSSHRHSIWPSLYRFAHYILCIIQTSGMDIILLWYYGLCRNVDQ